MAKFRTKARAIDLLGKGQIADLPTAISELWKNGYDAYADNLSCDLYLPGYKDNKFPIFKLSDDGVGMSHEDLISKWIVLGTDSKARGQLSTARQRLGKEPRIPMGEKGIGRLSVAYLGPQMLMLTKKRNERCQLLLDWRILDNYNLFIDDFEVPIEEFLTINEFHDKFKEALSCFKRNLNNKLWPEQKDLQNEIDLDIDNIELPTFLIEETVFNFVKIENNGTCFIIFKPHEQLLELSDFIENTQTDKETIIEIRKSLSGLYNEFIGNRKFETSFTIFDNIGRYNLLDQFFTSHDLENADHYIKGSFDENAFFSGEVRVFNEIVKHTFKPIRPPGKSPYGKFGIELGIIEGELKSSRLTEEQYRDIEKKVDLFGGLYIYRDGFRVLPYGRTEYDFLTFEKRRSSKAGYYFFSQRNMLGYIAISRDENSNLKDKAGREGLIANQAYREFKDDLIQFFKDLALTYFKSIGNEDESNLRSQQLEEIRKKKERLQESEKKKAKLTKKKFAEDLKLYTPQIENLTKEIDELFSRLSDESKKAEIIYNEFEKLTDQLEEKKNKLTELKLQKPYRVNLTSSQEKSYQDYQSKYLSLALKAGNCESIILETRKKFDIQNLKNAFMKRYNFDFREIHALINSYKNRYSESSYKILAAFDDEKTSIVEDYKTQLNQIPIENFKSKIELEKGILQIERLTNEFKNGINDKFSSFINHVENLNFDIDDDFLVSWYKEQNELIEKKLQDTNELAQLGMSIEIIDHQFNVMYSHISDSLNYFKNYVIEHEEIAYQFEQLSTAFQHLENNHRLLYPLYKTSRRSRSVIKGKTVKEYLLKFFDAIFIKNNIKMTSDESFDNYEYFTFESIIKPVFINIINNAIYWLIPTHDRKIHLTTKGNKVLILNNGEIIEEKILEDIFTLFFTRKRDGRGIGLYLARTNLRSIGYNIYATNDKEFNLLKGACFIIEPIE